LGRASRVTPRFGRHGAVQQIVIVDDVDNNVEVLRAIVNDIPETESHGFTSSRDAMAWSNVRQADGFVIDYHMPEPNGLTMIRTLRANPRYRAHADRRRNRRTRGRRPP
jgi:CheY-like chemotaxis protein